MMEIQTWLRCHYTFISDETKSIVIFSAEIN